MGPNIVSWCSNKQWVITRSTTKSEFPAIAHVTTEISWLQQILRELRLLHPSPPTLWCDNLGATFLAANPVMHSRMKHVDINFHYVRDKVVNCQTSCATYLY